MFSIMGRLGERQTLRVTVKFFASYREVIDKAEEVYDVPSGGSLKSLRVLITAAHPRLKDVEDLMLASVNETFVDDDEVELEDGDVVAFFPPLSGG
jgi:molybdopterin converting factor subunit 1